MKKITKLLAGAMLALMIGGTAFGQSALSIVEALQTTFRSVSDTMLPSVVEVDITQTKTYTNPLGNMNPFEWFFGNGNNRVSNNRVSNTINTSNNIVLFSNILPQQIYNNIRSFIEQGKAKMIALLKFYLDMKFDGLTTHESISTEIATIICVVGKVLSEEYGDRIAKACLESGSEDHVMLLLH